MILFFVFSFINLKKKKNFKEVFVRYENILAFYSFLKPYNKHLIENDQQRIELMFDLDEIFFNTNLTIVLKLRAFNKELLDELLDFYIYNCRN